MPSGRGSYGQVSPGKWESNLFLELVRERFSGRFTSGIRNLGKRLYDQPPIGVSLKDKAYLGYLV